MVHLQNKLWILLALLVLCYTWADEQSKETPPEIKIQQWLEQFNKANPQEKSAFVTELMKARRETLATLELGLAHTDTKIKLATIEILGHLGSDASPLFPTLTKTALQDAQAEVRTVATKMALRIDPNAMQTFRTAALQSSIAGVRLAGVDALALSQSKDAKTILTLVQVETKDKDANIQNAAKKALDDLAEAAMPGLFSLVQHSDAAVRASSRARIVKLDDKALLYLLNMLKHSDLNVRKLAIEVLGDMPKQIEAIAEPLFQTAFKDRVNSVQNAAINALVRLGKSALPFLKKTLQGPDWQARVLCLKILGNMGKTAEPLSADVVAAFKDPNELVKAEAQRAYAKISGISQDSQTQLDKLIADLRNPNPIVRREAIKALTNLGPQAGPAVPALASLLEKAQTGDLETQRALVQALGKIGKPAMPVLSNAALKNPNYLIRSDVVTLLGTIGGPEAIPVLMQAMSDVQWRVRKNAVDALAKILDAKTAPQVFVGLQSSDPNVRQATAELLGLLGKKASAAKPQLQTLATKDASILVRNAAKAALQKIP